MSARAATGIGFLAVLIWSTLALLTAVSGAVPPFQLVAMSFAVAFVIGALHMALTRRSPRGLFKQPPKAWLLGVGGLFGYHFLYFLALRNAPALEASLINYLWPLLIVLFSAALPAEKGGGGLKWWHAAGAALGLAGAVLVVLGEGGRLSGSGTALGYGAALGAALVWSGYSVASRLFAHVPTTMVTAYCLVTAIGALLAHIAFETTVWPATPVQWMAVLGMGLGPVGGAFYVWDYGVKHGDIRVLGAAAYMAPLLSTLLLVATGVSQATPGLWIACLLITGGAALAARDLLSFNR